MAGTIRIGTSGWHYDDWSGRFYPESLPQPEWLSFYARHFDTVEINNTFYHQPEDKTFDDWMRQAPQDFVFAVKANRYLTHLKRLKEPRQPLQRFLRGAKRLKGHLGPILYQLPPNWNPNFERLERFLQALPPGLQHVMEFRSRDWLCDRTYGLLRDHGVGLCVHDLLRRHPRRATADLVYLRFHGSGRRYGGRYRTRRLRSWAEWIESLRDAHDVYAYFNNDLDGHAIEDARRLRQLLQQD
jgi:uncharacterized protein YecE (DUF72 family)